MKTHPFTWTIILTLLAAMASGCRHRGPEFDPYQPAAVGDLETETLMDPPRPELRKPSTEPFTLGPGDQLEIELLGEEETLATTTVGPDGKIYFSILPGLDVWGLTLAETKALIEREYARFTREPPQVAVTLREVNSKRIWLLGRVQAPGVYPIASPMTLLEALALAGGTLTHREHTITLADNTEELADLDRSFVVRNGEILPVNFRRLMLDGDPAQNIYLQPDDFIYVPPSRAREVHVIGAVVHPRIVPYSEGLTLAGAIAHAGGTVRHDAYMRQVAVVRGSFSEPRIAVVDFHLIRMGAERDVRLEPQDIVYVPYTPYRHLRRYLDVIMNTFVTAVAINEGARAAIREAPPPTGILIPFGSGVIVTPSAP